MYIKIFTSIYIKLCKLLIYMPVTCCPSSSGSSGSKPLQKICKKQDYTERSIYKLIRPTSSGLFLTDTKI